MNKKELPSEMIQILRESHFAYLCTTDQNNQSHITPMFYVLDEKTKDVLVFTDSKSKKMNNIRVNPKVCLTVDVRNPEDPFENRGVMVQGAAAIEAPLGSLSITKDERFVRIYKAFSKKYPLLSEDPALTEAQAPDHLKRPVLREALVRVRASKMVYWRGPHFVTVRFNQ